MSERGFTLLELFLAIILLGIFAVGVYEVVLVGLRAVDASDEREEVRQQLAAALDQLTREASVASNVDVAQDQQVQIDADLDGNGSTENNIAYALTSGNLQRTYDTNPTTTLARNVTALDFDYVNSSGATLATPVGSQPDRDTIRILQITVTATNDQETISLASAAYLRNNQ